MQRHLAAILSADVANYGQLMGRLDRGEPSKWFAPYVDGPPTN